MKQELNDELKPLADKILHGDILNIPLLSKADFEKIAFYHLAKQHEEIALLKIRLTELENETVIIEESELPPAGNKKKKKNRH